MSISNKQTQLQEMTARMEAYAAVAFEFGECAAGEFFLNNTPPWQPEIYDAAFDDMAIYIRRVVCVDYPHNPAEFTAMLKAKAIQGWNQRIVKIVDSVGPAWEVYHDKH